MLRMGAKLGTLSSRLALASPTSTAWCWSTTTHTRYGACVSVCLGTVHVYLSALVRCLYACLSCTVPVCPSVLVQRLCVCLSWYGACVFVCLNTALVCLSVCVQRLCVRLSWYGAYVLICLITVSVCPSVLCCAPIAAFARPRYERLILADTGSCALVLTCGTKCQLYTTGRPVSASDRIRGNDAYFHSG